MPLSAPRSPATLIGRWADFHHVQVTCSSAPAFASIKRRFGELGQRVARLSPLVGKKGVRVPFPVDLEVKKKYSHRYHIEEGEQNNREQSRDLMHDRLSLDNGDFGSYSDDDDDDDDDDDKKNIDDVDNDEILSGQIAKHGKPLKFSLCPAGSTSDY
ncbi:hypothetical protein RRG08_048981 [Elysia crispata]|uniref:Uncharacterized protein n=1 Tax=Elysia crispata TaxID=231223 RepID=A0AAE0YD67_9GAST|nr:hypothetical protein RRG08_048981 [Elysia crispata]